ncbi:MAG: rod shape-determining protein MreC [Archangium gephyra]|uniref:Cell shape-determining protein MreC n=1 Tax=Archangium gephyra TaxID=48 RepID=A0A2W5SZG3_9BACT|nr:MAG: rod shape-determining protein MreC [Archangium gephyra]
MFNFLKRYRELLIVAALLLWPLISFLTTGHRGREPNFIDRTFLFASTPVQSLLTWSIDGVGDAVSGYVALRGSHEEALECRNALSLSQAELNSLKEMEAENQRLKAMLAYSEESVDQEVVARVIGINPSPQFLSIRINRGEDDGVRVGMPVVTPDGAVGQVVRSVGTSADVMLLTDPNSHVGGLVQRTRVRATVKGEGDGRRLGVDLVRREDDARDGDVLVTAGSDGIFPRGVRLGVLRTPERPPVGMFMHAMLEPAVDFSRVEEVLVIPVTMGIPSAAMGKGTP